MLDAWVRQRAVGLSPVKFRISTVFGQMAWSVLIPGTAGETDERIVSGVLETPEDLDAFVRTVLDHSPEGTVILGSYATVLEETLRSLIPCANGIPDGPKERLSEHMRQTALIHLRTPDPVTIYTDASATASRTGVGLGWVIVGGGLPLRVKCRFLPNTNHILIGEVMAIMYGLKSVVGVPELGTVVVRSDSKGAVRLLTKCWKGENVRGMGGCHEEFQQLLVKTRQLDVRFEWVKGHNGNVFNEAVDRLAMGTRRNHQMDLGHLDSELVARVTEDLKHS